ncbi:class I SAM-dependent methyltransferase [Thiocapsa marina]|uniref:Methyltransferase type 11 n=1 Tax=Thiocapsa marina 5811 TaxID=768671 RepID=F9U6A2_9GAMM|nr:class I SAM-dependent methyltransferase [Thiocapsa marina]EGV20675.1 Methyltransferase type 11 [Thiocapsa marina 5811]
MNEAIETNGVRRSVRVLQTWFPEVGAGGFTALDGSIEFYGRVQALLRPEMHVLDFGAGRGAALLDDPVAFRRDLRRFKGRVARVVACDVDEAVLSNPGADERLVIPLDAGLPFADNAFDLIVSDFVFEHVTNPALVSAELRRILKPGGWLCARTPNKYCPVSLVTRLIHNSGHTKILRWAQPNRREIDVFPTAFKLNSKRDLDAWFPVETFTHFTYRYEPEPGYFFNNRHVLALMLVVAWLLPPVMKTNLFIFLRKRS